MSRLRSWGRGGASISRPHLSGGDDPRFYVFTELIDEAARLGSPGLHLLSIVSYGLYRGRGSNTVNKYLLAGKTMPWYAMGLSIMATQASAITFISTTGQAYVDGMRFVQFYFGLPLAMVISARDRGSHLSSRQSLHGVRVPGDSASTRRRGRW